MKLKKITLTTAEWLRVVEDADTTEKQEEVQPEAEAQEEQPVLEEITEEEVLRRKLKN